MTESKRQSVERHVDSLVLYAGMFWLMVATNPFVHTRYIFNLLPIFALVTAINRNLREKTFAASPEPSTEGVERWSTAPSWAVWATIVAVWSTRFIFSI